MKHAYTHYFLYTLFFCCFFLTGAAGNAQTTAIPDSQFEQILINDGIDSDGTINGQVLTSDIVGVLNLNLRFVNDLTGLQDFTNLESLILDDGGVSWPNEIKVDLTANTHLKHVEISSFEGLSTLDLTGLASLEEFWLWESQGDVQTMVIDSLDLSTNTSINKISLGTMWYLRYINIQNGNNANMLNFELYLARDSQGTPPFPDLPMCIKVDDAAAAMANSGVYSTWTIYGIAPTFYDTGQCVLSINHFEAVEVALYPNPVTELFKINSQQNIETITIYDLKGKRIKHYTQPQESYSVTDLAKGLYLIEIRSVGNSKQTLKLLKN
ncbi:MAG TPA: T9SS type A sorting domain-containing protein [Flavobacteriaceae bacterium]|nr:T9SS type A sorting domain-containing protein [Flavobacteriaceae bacterium]